MSVDKLRLSDGLAFWSAIVDEAQASLDMTGNKTMACVVGTLRARSKSLQALLTALESREPTATDLIELEGAISTLKWLRDTDWVVRGACEERIEVEGTSLALGNALSTLIVKIEDALVA